MKDKSRSSLLKVLSSTNANGPSLVLGGFFREYNLTNKIFYLYIKPASGGFKNTFYIIYPNRVPLVEKDANHCLNTPYAAGSDIWTFDALNRSKLK